MLFFHFMYIYTIFVNLCMAAVTVACCCTLYDYSFYYYFPFLLLVCINIYQNIFHIHSSAVVLNIPEHENFSFFSQRYFFSLKFSHHKNYLLMLIFHIFYALAKKNNPNQYVCMYIIINIFFE